jgi:prepilin-type N-terminal cleavage/methylation domain-containing protein
MAFTEDIRCNHNLRGRFCSSGFSLVELLSVIAIIAIMMTLVAPAISGFGGAGARKGAVATVMGTLEQARVAALESGRDVMVVFARPNFPERDALIVLREPEDDTKPYEALTRWIRLPQKVIIQKPNAGESVVTAGTPNGLDLLNQAKMPVPLPANMTEDLSVIIFNSSGSVEFPTLRENRNIRVTEGVRGANGQEAPTITGFDMVSVARFTGRPQLDISYED